MTATVRQFLNSFDALPDPEKREAFVEILRRYGDGLPEVALVGVADELFGTLDAEEGGRKSP